MLIIVEQRGGDEDAVAQGEGGIEGISEKAGAVHAAHDFARRADAEVNAEDEVRRGRAARRGARKRGGRAEADLEVIAPLRSCARSAARGEDAAPNALHVGCRKAVARRTPQPHLVACASPADAARQHIGGVGEDFLVSVACAEADEGAAADAVDDSGRIVVPRVAQRADALPRLARPQRALDRQRRIEASLLVRAPVALDLDRDESPLTARRGGCDARGEDAVSLRAAQRERAAHRAHPHRADLHADLCIPPRRGPLFPELVVERIDEPKPSRRSRCADFRRRGRYERPRR